jgi:hypothetical protein
MKQTKLNSFIESCSNVGSGFIVALLATYYIFPLLGVEITFAQNFQIVSIMTIVSIVRVYIIRRFFNKKT